MNMDALRATFFEECEELIDSLTTGLQALSDGDRDSETINAIFRAVHSIKGAAGAFGFNELVAFTHRYETVLDQLRANRLDITPEVLRLVIRSSDALAEMVEGLRLGRDHTPAAVPGLIAELQVLAGGETHHAGAALDDTDTPDFVFTPVAFDFDPLPISGSALTVAFKPTRSFFASGLDACSMLGALERMGASAVRCDISTIPPLDRFDFDEAYLGWSVDLPDPGLAPSVRNVFAFAEGHGTLTLTESPASDFPAPAEGSPAEAVEHADLPGPAPESPAPDPRSGTMMRPAPEDAGSKPTLQSTLRVDPERVDRLINSVGELIINHAVIAQRFAAIDTGNNSDIIEALDEYRDLAREIQEGVMAIRAQPVKSLFQRMARVVREAAEATGKTVTFVTEGEQTEIDKTLLERLADPLTHMLRNAVDHGIEPAERRAAAGKPAMGSVRLLAEHRSGNVVITIADDGAGVNRQRVLAKAIEKGIIPADSRPTDAEIDALLFAPGFSTAETLTNLSGRGVGMDVVKTAITSLGGKVSIASTPGKGATFTIMLPLTLAVLDGMIVGVSGHKMVFPVASIIETVRAEHGDVHEVSPGERVLMVRGTCLPIVDLGRVLGFETDETEGRDRTFVLVSTQGTALAVSVDVIWDQRQVVVKGLESSFGPIGGIAGATILGDGRIALIVDPDALAGLAAHRGKRVSALMEA